MTEIWPAAGATAERLVQVLQEAHRTMANVRGGGGQGAPVTVYLQGVHTASRTMRGVVPARDLDRLLLTRLYWAALSNPAPSETLVSAVHQEVNDRVVDLEAALTEARRLQDRWAAPAARPCALVVADTNVYLHHPDPIDRLNWRALVDHGVRVLDDIDVVLPILVIDELDAQKRSREPKVRARARMTLKSIYEHVSGGVDASWVAQPRSLGEEVDSLGSGEVTVRLLFDQEGHVRLARPDDELVARASALGDLRGREPVHFVTYDTGAALRAKTAGLQAHRLQAGE